MNKVSLVEALDKCKDVRENLNKLTTLLPNLVDLFNSLGDDLHNVWFYPESCSLIAYVKTRDAFAPIRALRHGKWDRMITNSDPHTPEIRYDGLTDDGIRMTIYVNELPPSCRIEYEEVQVPACEAYTKRVPKVVCNDHANALDRPIPAG